MSAIAEELYAHLNANGTPNDSRTDELYREANGIPADAETDLEEVERWAFNVMNRKRAAEYWRSAQ